MQAHIEHIGRIPSKAFESQAAFPRWVNVAPALGLDTFSLSGGAVADDFDGDGYLDFFVSTSDLAGQLRFFRNGGDGTFADRTEAANLNGLLGGLKIDAVEGGQRRSLYRWVGSGGSFGGNPLRQYMGLGSAERVAQLVVFWPQSGREQVFAEVPVNAIVRVTEGREQLEVLALPAFKFNVEHAKRAEHHLHK